VGFRTRVHRSQIGRFRELERCLRVDELEEDLTVGVGEPVHPVDQKRAEPSLFGGFEIAATRIEVGGAI